MLTIAQQNQRRFTIRSCGAGFRSAMVVLTGLILTTVCAAASWADEGLASASQQPASECENTFWEVSSRCLSACPAVRDSMPNFSVSRCMDGRWSKSTLVDLQAHCKLRGERHRLIVYVHGNWMEVSDARTRAWKNFNRLTCTADECITFIAFTWPSQRQHGFARDVLEKKDRIDAECYYLAKLLSQVECNGGIGLLGFSFGGRVIMGALHIMHGGTIAGRCISTPVVHSARVSLFAPAFDRTSLTASGRYNQALYGVERIVNLYNSRDPVLRKFRFFDSNRPIAAGFAGLPVPLRVPTRADKPLAASPKIDQYDCQNIGRTHAELDYFKCSAISIAISNVLGK